MTENERSAEIVVDKDVPVPMSDGVVLRANVFRPAGSGRYPGLLMRTPYGKPNGGFQRVVRSGYAVVAQDSRGRYASGGTYIPYTVEGGTPDAQDGYESVEWLARQRYCNGKVGTFGGSYNAWMQWMLAKLRPPHLVAMCAWSIPLENTEVDWWGSFRPARRVKWWMGSMAPDIRRREGAPGPHHRDDAVEIWEDVERMRWLYFMPWLDLPRYLPEGLAGYVEDWLRHPNRRCWRFDEVHREVVVPNLDFSGWYDHCGGTMAHLGLMQKHGRTENARTQTRLVIGPWNHNNLGSRRQGPFDFGPAAKFNLQEAMIRWFDRWLKGDDNGVDREPAVRYFVMGSGAWKSASTWPPEGATRAVYYMDSDGDAHLPAGSGRLLDAPAAGESPDTYVYDPNDPVPTLWSTALYTEPSDRRRLDYRPDILIFRTPPLQTDVETVGFPEVVLFAATSAADTDFFVRLVDEDPGGPAMDVAYGMVRARHRHSLDEEDFITPEAVTEYRIRMTPTACRFLAGHRIRLEITSSDFPNHDRNHNTGGNDLAETELVAAIQEVHHSRQCPSRLVLPVLP
ncbi:MAG: CocE/NonD family hydrolase [Gemmatimonadetes bacterium]|nr:CocE/NonD family hydrolase [Gemmatimonadota bacterium]